MDTVFYYNILIFLKFLPMSPGLLLRSIKEF